MTLLFEVISDGALDDCRWSSIKTYMFSGTCEFFVKNMKFRKKRTSPHILILLTWNSVIRNCNFNFGFLEHVCFDSINFKFLTNYLILIYCISNFKCVLLENACGKRFIRLNILKAYIVLECNVNIWLRLINFEARVSIMTNLIRSSRDC